MKILLLSGSGFLGQTIVRDINLLIPNASILNTTSRKLAANKEIMYIKYASLTQFKLVIDESFDCTLLFVKCINGFDMHSFKRVDKGVYSVPALTFDKNRRRKRKDYIQNNGICNNVTTEKQ